MDVLFDRFGRQLDLAREGVAERSHGPWRRRAKRCRDYGAERCTNAPNADDARRPVQLELACGSNELLRINGVEGEPFRQSQLYCGRSVDRRNGREHPDAMIMAVQRAQDRSCERVDKLTEFQRGAALVL